MRATHLHNLPYQCIHFAITFANTTCLINTYILLTHLPTHRVMSCFLLFSLPCHQSQARFSPCRLASAETASHELQGHTSAALTSLKSILDEDKNQASMRLSQLSKEVSGYNPAGRESIDSLRALLQGGQGPESAPGQGLGSLTISDHPSTLPARAASYSPHRRYPLTASGTVTNTASSGFGSIVDIANRNISPSYRTAAASTATATTVLRSSGSNSSNVSPLHPTAHHAVSTHYLSDSSTTSVSMRPRSSSVRGTAPGTPLRGQRQGQGARVGGAMHAKENMGVSKVGPTSTHAIAFKHTDGYVRDDSDSGAKRLIIGSSTKRHAKQLTPTRSNINGRQPRGIVATTVPATASKDEEISALSLRIRQRLLSGP